MKVKQISDSTLKITILLDDLEERGMEIADFLMPHEKTEEFFYSVLDELELPLTFRESGMLSFRVTPKPDKVDIFVTKSEIDKHINFEDLADFDNLDEVSQMTPADFLQSLEKNLKDKSAYDKDAVQRLADIEAEEEAEPYIYYVLHFDHLHEVVQFAQAIDVDFEESELYKMNDDYFMTVLLDVSDRSADYPDYLLSRMLEYTDDSTVTRPVLQEHGQVLLPLAAVEELKKVSLA
ncbi:MULTISPECIES: adaptor protein MecA [Streptococcus]|uniref:adaptor protein MecA n=1 Tax=Streptococcus TaxID=1301 RepID=UPI000CF46E03|nr:adaptor protein MecA [Streptococcus suis]NQG19012.1 adaptor protein MecA [Streptococcus suis]NQO46268.1 adaptor protein MecA [Streptococcus suis]WNF83768.1 adaptor protein MecA [Streptococcus suis]